MDYVRKLVGGAIAGALLSTVVSLNRKRISRLLHIRNRHQRIVELRLRFEADLQDIERLAEIESEAYVEKYQDHFATSAKNEGFAESTVEGVLVGIGASIRNLIYLDRKARATRIYADQLYALDEDLAIKQDEDAKMLLDEAKQARSLMNEAGFPLDLLFERLHAHPRV
jgi:hypothetical protein